jgi:dihydrodipicolinate synthase/N-acetylneuraminate lyase
LAKTGRWNEAMALQRALWPVNELFARHALAACVKGGLEMMGYPVGAPLPPQAPLSEAGRAELRRALEAVGALP